MIEDQRGIESEGFPRDLHHRTTATAGTTAASTTTAIEIEIGDREAEEDGHQRTSTRTFLVTRGMAVGTGMTGQGTIDGDAMIETIVGTIGTGEPGAVAGLHSATGIQRGIAREIETEIGIEKCTGADRAWM